MAALPIAEWQASLEEMEATLGSTLAALDRYQAGWEQMLEARNACSDGVIVDELEVRLRDWDSRLLAAADLAHSVERELNDRQNAVGVWHEAVLRWRGTIKS